MGASAYLTQYYDPALKLPDDETVAHMEGQERARLAELLAIAEAAGSIPRRLGAEASSEELATDRRRCRRIAHAARQCLKDWGNPVPAPGDVSRRAAQVVWDNWWADHSTWLVNRIRYIATWSMNGGDEIWAKSAVVKLNNEANWISYALRD